VSANRRPWRSAERPEKHAPPGGLRKVAAENAPTHNLGFFLSGGEKRGFQKNAKTEDKQKSGAF
ncbi:hypothetical protein, partial [Stenotrophomonas maltophilia]|uniref:hypothetical protein n=1 Tax=Stenotrophomonas maltophilia TaxID=40324 RepID=UPI000D684F51